MYTSIIFLFLKVEKARSGELVHWESHPKSALAHIILIDQFCRNIFRVSRVFLILEILMWAVELIRYFGNHNGSVSVDYNYEA